MGGGAGVGGSGGSDKRGRGPRCPDPSGSTQASSPPSDNAPWQCALGRWRKHFPGFHSCSRAGQSITNSASRPGSKPAFTTAGCGLWASRLTSLGLLAHLQKHLRCTGL